MPENKQSERRNEKKPAPIANIEEALTLCRRSLYAVAAFSLAINILLLTPMFYMINVFDKAVGTASIATLVSLAAIALFLYCILAILEWVRSQMLIHIAARLDIVASPRLYDICFQHGSGAISAKGMGSQPLSDLNAFRQFIASQHCAVIFDLPLIPIFLVLMFLFHPALAAVSSVWCSWALWL